MSDKFKIIDGEVYERTQFLQTQILDEGIDEQEWEQAVLEMLFETDKGKFVQERARLLETYRQPRYDLLGKEVAVWGYMKPQDRTYMVLKYENKNRKIS